MMEDQLGANVYSKKNETLNHNNVTENYSSQTLKNELTENRTIPNKHLQSNQDVAMPSVNSEENLLPSTRHYDKKLKRNLTPLEIQDLPASPSNRFVSFRDDGTTGGDKDLDLSDEELYNEEFEYDDINMNDDRNTFSYANFLKAHSCYDIVPNSSKIVVFDSKLKVKKAFFALVHNNLRAAPVWSSSRQEFVGMLTITDFIKILIRYYKSPLEKMWELEEHQIETWRELTKKNLQPILIRISPTESLYSGVQMLVKNKIHRLPIIDPKTGNALYILTHKKLLKYVFDHIDDLAMPDFMGYTLEQLGIGSFENVAKVHPWTTVIEALRIFDERGVSALPIVDENSCVVDIYSKFDVINLAAERTYNNLDLSVQEALKHRQEGFEGVQRCQRNETLYVIIDRIAVKRICDVLQENGTSQDVDVQNVPDFWHQRLVHRLVVVDETNHVLGIISLSDILRFLVLQPPKLDETQQQTT